MRNRAHRPNGEPPCRVEVNTMTVKRTRKAGRRKQRRSFLPWIDKIAAAIFWIVKTILLIVDWFIR